MTQFYGYVGGEAGAQLRPSSWPAPVIGPNDVHVRVEYCGICHSDLHMLDNDWGMTKYPFVGGHEVVGRVVAVGELVASSRIGERVGIGWQRGACLDCNDCVKGNENLCDAQQGTIVGAHGGFASDIIVDGRFAFPIPDGLDSAAASPLLCAGVTVYSALIEAGVRPGSHVGVIGIGGLGHLAVQFAKHMGARVTVFTSSPDKAGMAAQLGASEHVSMVDGKPANNPSREFDILLNTVAADLDWMSFLKMLGSDGTLSFVGVPAKPIVLPIGMLLGKRRRIMASPIGGRAVMREMLQLAADHGIAPWIEVSPVAEINDALQKVRENKVRFRAVLRMSID